MPTMDEVGARAADVLPPLLANELAKLQDIPADRLRLALAHHLVARRLPETLFPDLPRDVSQQPCPDDMGDARGALLLAMDVFGSQDGCCDATRDIVVAVLGNVAARVRALDLWQQHCRFEALEAIGGGR